MWENIFILNKCCSFLLCIHQRKKYHMFQKQLSSTTVSTLIMHQYTIMISERSCYTEDWSNDAENSALLHINKFYFKAYCDEWGGAESRGNGARPVEWMIMNDTCATHRSRVPRRSFGRNKRRSDDIGRRERTRPGFYFMFCVRQSSARGCRVSFVFVYLIKCV